MMHDEAVLCGTFSRDGEHLATGSTVSHVATGGVRLSCWCIDVRTDVLFWFVFLVVLKYASTPQSDWGLSC